jgi:hypothetical protein
MPGIKGMKRTAEHNRKIAIALKKHKRTKEHSLAISKSAKKRLADPKANPNYRGEAVGYQGIHIWLRKFFGLPKSCEYCGITGKKLKGQQSPPYPRYSLK